MALLAGLVVLTLSQDPWPMSISWPPPNSTVAGNSIIPQLGTSAPLVSLKLCIEVAKEEPVSQSAMLQIPFSGCFNIEDVISRRIKIEPLVGKYSITTYCTKEDGTRATQTATSSFTMLPFDSPYPSSVLRERYLKLVQDTATGSIYHDGDLEWSLLNSTCPPVGITMTGGQALEVLRFALETVIVDGVPGDFLEAGVWRGGSSVFARAVLAVTDDGTTQPTQRAVWLCDSFEGLPLATTSHDSDMWSTFDVLSVSIEDVMRSFQRFDLFDERLVKFVKGFFRTSLPTLPKELQLAVLRLDGDMFESTIDTLFNTYDRWRVCFLLQQL
jgi:hypothetical protein